MYGFLVGWGIFWMLIWAAWTALFWNSQDSHLGAGVVGLFVSFAYLVAVFIGKMIAG